MMTQENADVLEFYFNKFDTTIVQPIVFIEFALMLVGIFLIRYVILCRIEKDKLKTKNKVNIRNIAMYIGGHCALELIAAFIVSDCLVKLTNADPANYAINIIVAPGIGALLAIYADNKLLIPIENVTGIGNVFKKYISSGDSKKDSDKNEAITININNGNSTESSLPSMKFPASDKLGNNSQLLSEELAESDDFNTTVIKAINEIKTENGTQTSVINSIQSTQNDQKEQLDSTILKLQSVTTDLAILKESEMINKKIELKKMMYDCLNAGYATREENEKITLYYHSYIALGGNHEIESLYQDRYIKLHIQDKPHQLLQGPQITSTPKYYYGQFDDEYIDQK